MKRRALLAMIPAVLSAPALAQPVASDQDKADLARVAAYLNGLHTLKARFIQLAPDGAITRGTTWLERPGRMRFQYDPPTPLLLIAGHGLIIYYDSQLKQVTNIPLGQTPLGILLADTFSFDAGLSVTGINRQPGLLQIGVARRASPGDGTLTLVFNDSPLVLRQWSVVDSQRRETRISLLDVELGGTFDPDLFNFIDPKFFDRTPEGHR